MEYPKYDKYKDSGIDWLGKLPKNWTLKKLKYHVILINKKHDEDLESTKNYIGLENVISWGGEIFNNNDNYTPEGISNTFETGNVLFAKLRPYLAKAFVANEDGICSSEFLVFQTKMTFYNQYFLYLLLTDGIIKTINSSTYGSKMPRASWDYIGNIFLPTPEISEQQSIANFLDRETARIDTLIEKKLKFIETLKEKRIALISRAVTKGLNPEVPMKDSGIEWLGKVPEHWEVKRLKYQVQKVGSGVTPSGGATIYEDEGIPLIRSQNIYSNRFKLDDIAFITESIHNSMANSKVKNGDVLLNITGASLGRSFYMVDTFEEANVNQHVCIIRPNQSKVNTRFLHLLIISDAGQAQIWYDQTGSGREGLNFVSIKNFFFAFPPTLQEQNQIVETISKEVEKIDLVVIKTEAAIEKLKEYKTALISAAVTGKIKVC